MPPRSGSLLWACFRTCRRVPSMASRLRGSRALHIHSKHHVLIMQGRMDWHLQYEHCHWTFDWGRSKRCCDCLVCQSVVKLDYCFIQCKSSKTDVWSINSLVAYVMFVTHSNFIDTMHSRLVTYSDSSQQNSKSSASLAANLSYR